MHIEALQVRSQHRAHATWRIRPARRCRHQDELPATLVAVYGAIGGATAAAAMTVLRLGARRAGLIDLMVPEAVEHGSTLHGAQPCQHPALRSATDQLCIAGTARVGAAFGPL
jgi:hypothetical protein